MVAVLVRDDHGRERRRIHARGLQPLRQLTRAEAGIEEDPRPVALDEGAVARATGTENAESHVGRL
jgi:hypothetical protein